jgi:HEPN domain-containing protein
MRIEEARILLKVKKYSGAYYLAGYAVEFGLKACIAKKTQRHEYPDKDFAYKCYTHDLEKLLLLTGLKSALDTDARLQVNWAVVKDWNEQARFDRKNRVEAQELYDDIVEPAHGVRCAPGAGPVT